MPIDLQKIKPVEFCILVAWVKGMSTGDIAKTLGKQFNKTPGSIRGIINHKMNIKRDDMTIEARQRLLDVLKDNRQDGGRIVDPMFVAIPIKKMTNIRVGPLSQYRKPKEEEPKSDVSAKIVKKRSKKQIAAEAAKKKAAEEEARAARELGRAQRGYYDTPLEYLEVSGLMMQNVEKGTIEKSPLETHRFNAGKKMRQVFAGCQLSPMKSQDFEMVGGGTGAGVAIPAKIMEFQSQVAAIKKTMAAEDFNDLYSILVKDEFIWCVPSKRGRDVILQAIRRALDAVAVYFKMMEMRDFVRLWGYEPKVDTKVKTRSEARRDSGAARSMINEAQKDLR